MPINASSQYNLAQYRAGIKQPSVTPSGAGSTDVSGACSATGTGVKQTTGTPAVEYSPTVSTGSYGPTTSGPSGSYGPTTSGPSESVDSEIDSLREQHYKLQCERNRLWNERSRLLGPVKGKKAHDERMKRLDKIEDRLAEIDKLQSEIYDRLRELGASIMTTYPKS